MLRYTPGLNHGVLSSMYWYGGSLAERPHWLPRIQPAKSRRNERMGIFPHQEAVVIHTLFFSHGVGVIELTLDLKNTDLSKELNRVKLNKILCSCQLMLCKKSGPVLKSPNNNLKAKSISSARANIMWGEALIARKKRNIYNYTGLLAASRSALIYVCTLICMSIQ